MALDILKRFSPNQIEQLKKEARLELARQDFWEFCKLLAPDFYKESRTYQKVMCEKIQEFLESDKKLLVVNMPPRHGKSRTLENAVKWSFGRNPNLKIMTASYNETLSTTFSRAVRDEISERKAGDLIVYHDVFPKTKVKRGSSAAGLWTLDGCNVASYLATSPTGTATGFGASLMIIDDTIKNHEEANNEVFLDGLWRWFTNTMLSRREAGAKIIIVMTRWNTKDLSGRIIEHFKGIGEPFDILQMKAKQDDGSMLCDEVLSESDYKLLQATLSPDILEANYNQTPIDLVGRLYNVGFGEYLYLPKDEKDRDCLEEVCAYCDTADRGDDYLCLIIFGVFQRKCYVLDVYFTKESMEITEPETARRLSEFNVTKAYIESNNGGRGFGRSVERILRDRYRYYGCYIDLFTQSRNKKARILSSATWCQENIVFPIGWEYKFPEFHRDVLSYQREGKMAHDDAEDCLAGIYDRIGRKDLFDFRG